MQIKGGFARRNGVTFLSENFVATATRNRDETLTVDIKRRPFTNAHNRVYNRLSHFPLLRNIISLLTVVLQLKPVAIIVVTAVIVSVIPAPQTNSLGDVLLSYLDILITFGSLLFVFLFFYKFGAVKKYHGAEHKAANAYTQCGEISVISARNASRIHERCGTNFLTAIILVAAVVQLAAGWDFDYSLLIGMAVAGELGRLRNGTVKKPFLRIGEFLQKNFLTAEPSDEELEVALNALRALETKESSVVK